MYADLYSSFIILDIPWFTYNKTFSCHHTNSYIMMLSLLTVFSESNPSHSELESSKYKDGNHSCG